MRNQYSIGDRLLLARAGTKLRSFVPKLALWRKPKPQFPKTRDKVFETDYCSCSAQLQLPHFFIHHSIRVCILAPMLCWKLCSVVLQTVKILISYVIY